MIYIPTWRLVAGAIWGILSIVYIVRGITVGDDGLIINTSFDMQYKRNWLGAFNPIWVDDFYTVYSFRI